MGALCFVHRNFDYGIVCSAAGSALCRRVDRLPLQESNQVKRDVPHCGARHRFVPSQCKWIAAWLHRFGLAGQSKREAALPSGSHYSCVKATVWVSDRIDRSSDELAKTWSSVGEGLCELLVAETGQRIVSDCMEPDFR